VADPAPMAEERGALAVDVLTPNRLRVNADARGAMIHGPILVRQTCYPGWRAYAGKGEVLISPAPDCQQSVPSIPQGENAVYLVFEPASFKLGCFLTLLAMMLLVTMATMRRRLT
jgi:uncharacterized membrane protein YfhO